MIHFDLAMNVELPDPIYPFFKHCLRQLEICHVTLFVQPEHGRRRTTSRLPRAAKKERPCDSATTFRHHPTRIYQISKQTYHSLARHAYISQPAKVVFSFLQWSNANLRGQQEGYIHRECTTQTQNMNALFGAIEFGCWDVAVLNKTDTVKLNTAPTWISAQSLHT